MRKSKITLALASVALCGLLSPAHAAKDATCTLVMPSGIDPARLTFTQEGFFYSNTDGTTPGDQGGAPITGSMLLTTAFGGGGGLELHGAIPALSAFGTTNPVVEVDLFTDYMGNFEGASDAGNSSYTPWGVEHFSGVEDGYAQGFRFFLQPGSAEMNTEAFYGVLSATLEDPTDPTGFSNAHFGFMAYTASAVETPEPGSVALLIGVGISGALFARKRRRK